MLMVFTLGAEGVSTAQLASSNAITKPCNAKVDSAALTARSFRGEMATKLKVIGLLIGMAFTAAPR